ncbi:hypothetical protein [Cellulosilyticum ruminicola]|uniref:hypothetical protein n=1 Tax=Cellulosilyticum ruminicola TaxID=425254 RepID=UPI0012EE096F|nr:hypothetical protein [Cellulosilyticum ruminicola]
MRQIKQIFKVICLVVLCISFVGEGMSLKASQPNKKLLPIYCVDTQGEKKLL